MLFLPLVDSLAFEANGVKELSCKSSPKSFNWKILLDLDYACEEALDLLFPIFYIFAKCISLM